VHRLLTLVLFLGISLPLIGQAPQPAAGDKVRLQLPNSDVRDALNMYERLTGKRLVYDNTVQGPVNIVVSTEITRDEAIKIIETNLLLNGFSLIPGEGDIIKVIGLAKNPRTAGVPIFSELDALPSGDKVVTFIFSLEFADPTELQQTLQQYVAPQLYTSIIALPKSQALLVTESTSVIRGIAKVIKEVDIPPAVVVSEFVKLERADAEDVLEKLESIFEKQPAPGGAVTVARPARDTLIVEGQPPPAPAGTAPDIQAVKALSEESIIIGKLKLTADIRTNRIHVITRPINLPFIRKLITEFDRDVKFGQPTVRPLKFVSAGEVLPVIVKAITEPGAKAEEGAPTTTTTTTQTTTTTPGQAGLGTTTGDGAGGDFQVTEGLSTEPVDTKPEAVTVGNTKIIADKRANSIIVLGNEEVKQKIFQVLDEIDIRAPQVLLNTVIGELTLSQDEEFGVDYLLRFTGGNGAVSASPTPGTTPGATPGATPGTTPVAGSVVDLGRTGVAALGRFTQAPLLDPQTLMTAGAFATTPTGLTAFIAATDTLAATVRALESTGRFKVTQRPMVFTSNNKKAIIASGQEVAVPTQTLTALNTVDVSGVPSVSSSIQFKRVALQLEVVPLINSDREVSLDILQKVDDIAGTTVIGGNEVPNIATRFIRTNVSVANGATVVLGGLIKRTNNINVAGIPWLGRIPVLGYLFRNTASTRARSELIILIRPCVVGNPDEAVAVTEHEQDRIKLEMPPDFMDPPEVCEPQTQMLMAPQPLLREYHPPLREYK
jgi:general secretion pathway protein D